MLAGGALSGSAERHPIASPAPEPIGSAMSYDADVDRARHLMPLVRGVATSLTEAATRFALSHPAMGHYFGRYGDAATVRGRTRRAPKRSTTASCARPAVSNAAGILGRTTTIAQGVHTRLQLLKLCDDKVRRIIRAI